MEKKTPAAHGGRGVELLPGASYAPSSLTTYRTQLLAARFAISMEAAAVIAPLAFVGGAHV